MVEVLHFRGGEIIPRRVLCPWRAHLLASALPAVARATAACSVRCEWMVDRCYARLEDRPLGVWVGEGLKEEIAGERGPRRPSQRPHDEKFWESFRRIPPATMVYHIKGVLVLVYE